VSNYPGGTVRDERVDQDDRIRPPVRPMTTARCSQPTDGGHLDGRRHCPTIECTCAFHPSPGQ